MPTKKNCGQSLVEILIALMVAVFAIIALVKISTTALRNAQFARHQAQATKYAQRALEETREYLLTYGWTDFVSNCEDTGRLTISGLTAPFTAAGLVLDCCQPGVAGTDCSAEPDCQPINDRCQVEVAVSWQEAGTTHQSELKTIFTDH